MARNGANLKSTLWEAANTLRGSAVDRTDWKGYILPLLFFKRISDVWNEETAEAAETYGDADPSAFPEVHRFQVPEGCHWNDIRETPANVGTALAKAMQEIERANPDTLYRVFGTADWANKEKFSDELLKDLIEGFSSISLGNEAVSTDILGDAYLLQRDDLGAVLDILEGTEPPDDLAAVFRIEEVLRPAFTEETGGVDDQYLVSMGRRLPSAKNYHTAGQRSTVKEVWS